MSNPSISVIIPVRNEGTKIRACIEGILAQTVKVLEIIVIDSGSTDGTLEILGEYDIVKVIEIPGSQFNHGATRNLGVQHAQGEFLLFTVGDARAYDNTWIENLIKVFDGDSSLGAVCGTQVVPHEKDKNPVEWFRSYSQPKVVKYAFTKEQFAALSPEQKSEACSWDDVTAMYRKEALVKVPFQATNYGEDMLWVIDALLAGYTIAYNPAARVYHYHLEDAEFTYKRTVIVLYHKYKLWGYKENIIPITFKFYREVANLLRKAEDISLSDKMKWWKYNIEIRKAMIKAGEDVEKAINEGEESLDKLHHALSGKPPVPKKNHSIV